MTELLEQAFGKVRGLSPEMQDEIARMVLAYAGHDDELIELTPEEETALGRSLEAAARGEFATDEQIQAIWAKHGL